MHRSISGPSQGVSVNLNKFNYKSRPSGSLQKLLQSQFSIRSLEISPHGKTGVIFIETNGGSFVLKSNNEGPMDEFLNRMAGLMNLSVPETICYCCSDMIFHKLVFEIEKYHVFDLRFCERDEILYARMKSRLDFPFYQIIEYIPSISLAEVGKDRFERHLIEVHKLNSMGMCIGFDLLTNNSDRFKLLWGGDGNINNVLIQVKDFDAYENHEIQDRSNIDVGLGSYVFIDHSGFLLDLKNEIASKNFQRYMDKVCDFQVAMIRSLSQEYPIPKEFQKLKDQIQLFTHYTLNEFDFKQISRGIVFITNKFLEVFQRRELQDLYNTMKRQTKQSKTRKGKQNQYWNQYWNEALSKINLNFLKEVYIKMAAIYTTYPEIIHNIIAEVETKMPEMVRAPQFAEMEGISEEPFEEKQSEGDPGSLPKVPDQSDSKLESESEIPPNESQILLNDPNSYQEMPPPLEKMSVSVPQGPRKSPLSNHQLFAELKVVKKWRDKLVKYKEVNSDHLAHPKPQ